MRLFPALLSLIALLGLAACGSASKPDNAVAPQGAQDAGPIALAPKHGGGPSLAMSVNQDEVAKAVERLRITKKKGQSPFDQAGADLNSDGKPEALVLLTGQDWCSPQGCTLVVFQSQETGYRPISQIVGVRPPVAAGPGANAGWRDLIVKTGPTKIVRLQFSGGGYPSNAAGQPDGSADVAQSEVLLGDPNPQTAAAPPQ